MAIVIIFGILQQQTTTTKKKTNGFAIVFTWFYNNTESIFICILFHVMNNVVTIYIETIFPHLAVSFIFGIMPWVVAFVLIRFYGKETLTGK